MLGLTRCELIWSAVSRHSSAAFFTEYIRSSRVVLGSSCTAVKSAFMKSAHHPSAFPVSSPKFRIALKNQKPAWRNEPAIWAGMSQYGVRSKYPSPIFVGSQFGFGFSSPDSVPFRSAFGGRTSRPHLE